VDRLGSDGAPGNFSGFVHGPELSMPTTRARRAGAPDHDRRLVRRIMMDGKGNELKNNGERRTRLMRQPGSSSNGSRADPKQARWLGVHYETAD